MMNTKKTVVILLIPVLFIFLLRFCFPFVMREFIKDRFGCPCTNPDFNSNHVVTYFWQIAAVVCTLISIPCGFRIPKDCWGVRILYICAVAVVCYFLSTLFSASFMLR